MSNKETTTYTSEMTTTTQHSTVSGGKPFDSIWDDSPGEDPFTNDFFKKYIEGSGALPSHGQIKRVHYNKQDDKDDLPDEFNLYIKPTEKVDYQASDCTGRKRAVLIGINYYQSKFQLGGSLSYSKF